MSDRMQPQARGGNNAPVCCITALTQDVSASGCGSVPARVEGLQTVPIDATLPVLGQVLQYDGSKWAPATPVDTGITQLTQDVTTPSGSGSQPATVVALQHVAVSATPPADGQVLQYDAVATSWKPATPIDTGITQLTQDVTTPSGSGSQPATVVALQHYPVANAAPMLGDVLTWDGAEWLPLATSTGGLASPLFASFSSSTTQPVTIPPNQGVTANTAYYATLNTVDVQYGGAITITNNTFGDPTRVTFSEPGYYEISFSAQVEKKTGTPAQVSLWLEVNREDGGGPIANSNSIQTIGGTVKNAIPFCLFIEAASPGDYVELGWSANEPGVELVATSGLINPTRPDDPSLIVVVNRIWAPAPSIPVFTPVAVFAAKSLTYNTMNLCDLTVGPYAVTLPTAIGYNGQQITVKKVSADSNLLTVNTVLGQTIDGSATQTWTQQWRSMSLIAYNGNWCIL